MRTLALAASVAVLLSGCGLDDARRAAIANAKVKPVDMATALRPGLVGMPDYPATGWEPTDLQKPPAPPKASTLTAVGLRSEDVSSTYRVQTMPDGSSLGIPTLDFCEGTYPSEQLRVKRLQRAAYTDAGDYAGISSEVVVYRNAAAAQQALEEVRAAARACTEGQEIATYDGHTLVIHFNPAPGPSDTPLTDARVILHVTMRVDGKPQTTLLIFQVEGRVLAALYASDSSGTAFPQTTLDSFFALAGDIAGRLRTYVAATGTTAA